MKRIILTMFAVLSIFALAFGFVFAVLGDTTPSFTPPTFSSESTAAPTSTPTRGSNTIAKGSQLTMGISLMPPPLPLATEVVIRTSRQPILRLLPDGIYEIVIR